MVIIHTVHSLEEMKVIPNYIKYFYNYLTINVSEFFRNPTQWQYFENKILRETLTQKSQDLKIWSLLSTGDEPYIIVMILNNTCRLKNKYISY